MKFLYSVIQNSIDLPSGQPFTAILGLRPSHGARSPHLWNAAFKAHRACTRMYPMDVSTDNLYSLLEILDGEPAYLGGAVAQPYKETVARWLGDRLTPEASRIGAVNCLFRNGDRLWGTNTDGEAALNCLEHVAGPLAEKRVLLVGIGGAGKAVAAYLAGRAGTLTLAGRSDQHITEYAYRLGVSSLPWRQLNAELSQAHILVNCTSVGSAAADLANESPLCQDQIAMFPSDAIVFDIIYDPPVTLLIELARLRGLIALNGEKMNLEQAVIAFGHTLPSLGDRCTTRSAMVAAASRSLIRP